MTRNHLLAQAATDELVKLYNHVENMLLHALEQIKQAEDERVKASHRVSSEAFIEELDAIRHELLQRAENFDPLADQFLHKVNMGIAYRATG